MDGTGDIVIIYRIWFCAFIEYVYLGDTLTGIFLIKPISKNKPVLRSQAPIRPENII